jgi:1-acyl-sn-glycerol-3-phosphate acyltransferase
LLKVIVSAGFWTVGVVYFVLFFCFMTVCLAVSPPKKLHPVVRRLMRFQLAVMGVRLSFGGLDNLDPQKSYLFMGNHESMFDLFAIPAAIPVYTVGFEASYHFSLPLWGYLIRKWGNIPAHRSSLHKGISSLKDAARVIKSGTSIVVLPEGGRTLNGQLGEFKKGPFLVALSAKADIVPFVFDGMYAYNNIHSWHLHPGPVRVVFGQPISYQVYKGRSVAELRRMVHRAMAELKKADRNFSR